MDVFFLEFSWLRKWKLRAARDKERQMEEKKQQENSNGMNWFFTVKLCSVRHVILFLFHACDFWKSNKYPFEQSHGIVETSRVKLDQTMAERTHWVTPC